MFRLERRDNSLTVTIQGPGEVRHQKGFMRTESSSSSSVTGNTSFDLISTSRLAVLTRGGCGDGPGWVPTELHSGSRSAIIDFSACQSQPRGDPGKWQVLVYSFHSKWESVIPWDWGLGFSGFLSIRENLATFLSDLGFIKNLNKGPCK